MGSYAPDASSQRALNVLRLAVPDISEYRNSCPALVFHATHDNAEKVNNLALFELNAFNSTVIVVRL